MNKHFNVIQINGVKGILFVIFAAICLAAGFIVFPGLVLKTGWNFVSGMFGTMPAIGLVQGTLLWGIVVVSYFTFKKKGFFVEFKSGNCLSQSEMDEVMHKIRMEQQKEIIARSIIKSAELQKELHKELNKDINNDNSEIKQ